MRNLLQEKSLRDQEPYLRGFTAIVDRVIVRGEAPIGELPHLSEQGRLGMASRRVLWSNIEVLNKPQCNGKPSYTSHPIAAKIDLIAFWTSQNAGGPPRCWNTATALSRPSQPNWRGDRGTKSVSA